MQEEHLFSFRKIDMSGAILCKTIEEILLVTKNEEIEGWYFIGRVVEPPVTIIVQQEIRIVLTVCDNQYPTIKLNVILNEAAVRKYLSIIKEDQCYRFKNGFIIIQSVEDNFVYINDCSEVILLEIYRETTANTEVEHKQRDLQVISQKQSKQQNRTSNKTSKQTPKFVIREKEQIFQAGSERIENREQMPSSKNKSVSIQNRQTTSEFIKIRKEHREYANFRAKVLCHYNVGRGKANNGVGYQVEQVNTRERYQVVMWSQATPMPPLVHNRVYEFKSFKVNRKTNYNISFYSHFQYSSVQQFI